MRKNTYIYNITIYFIKSYFNNESEMHCQSKQNLKTWKQEETPKRCISGIREIISKTKSKRLKKKNAGQRKGQTNN